MQPVSQECHSSLLMSVTCIICCMACLVAGSRWPCRQEHHGRSAHAMQSHFIAALVILLFWDINKVRLMHVAIAPAQLQGPDLQTVWYAYCERCAHALAVQLTCGSRTSDNIPSSEAKAASRTQ